MGYRGCFFPTKVRWRTWIESGKDFLYTYKNILILIHIHIHVYIYIHIFIYYRFKRKTKNGSPGLFPYSNLPFAHRTNESLSFVHFLTKNQTEVIRLQTD
jgi:hypothetical protein